VSGKKSLKSVKCQFGFEVPKALTMMTRTARLKRRVVLRNEDVSEQHMGSIFRTEELSIEPVPLGSLFEPENAGDRTYKMSRSLLITRATTQNSAYRFRTLLKKTLEDYMEVLR
jgi:hypothetical protein